MWMSLTDIAILNIKSSNYCCIISGISKNETIDLNARYRIDQKKRSSIKHKNLLSHIKMDKEIVTFCVIEIKKKNFTAIKVLSSERCRH